MYEELIKRLRNRRVCIQSGGDLETDFPIMKEAADAIEQLSNAGSAYGRGWTLGYGAGREESKPSWVPVTERLPVHDWNVLICYDWTGISGTVYREIGIASIEELERDPNEMFRPVAWMPLPEPPKEETE